MDSRVIRCLIEQSWSIETSLDPEGARHDLRNGQCLTTALLVERFFGGQVLATESGGARGTHYVNAILAEQHDFCRDHEVSPSFAAIDDPRLLLTPPVVRRAFHCLEERWLEAIHSPLPIPEIEHVAIVPEGQLTGGYIRPSVGLVVLHGPTEHAVSDPRLFPGQTVWIKVEGGPIVSRSILKSWFVSTRSHFPLSLLKEYCEEQAGERIERWWKAILAKDNEFIAIFHLQPDVDLEIPLYPATHARHRTLQTLDTWRLKLLWLHAGEGERQLPPDPRPPTWRAKEGPRYRFRWEHLLDETVSTGIDERTRRGAKFQDRIAAIDRMLQLYLLGAEDAERKLVTEFSSEDLDLLAEIFEGQSSAMRPAIEFVEGMPAYLRTVSREVGLADDETAAHLRWLASAIDSQTIAERIAVLDFLQRYGAVNWMLEGEQTA